MRAHRGLALVLLASATGCKKDAPPPATQAACDDTVVADALPLRRLSAAQHRWTIRDLMITLGAEDDPWLDEVIDEHWGAFLPPDTVTGAEGQVRGGYRRLDQDVHQQHVEGYLITAQGVASEYAFGSAWRATELMRDTCALDEEIWGSGPGDCAEAWIRRVGALVHRRPLSEAQVREYQAIFDGASAEAASGEEAIDIGFRHVLITMLASPWATYHVELAGSGGELDAYAVANRVSYHFWQSSPDDALYAAAADGSLLNDAGYRAEVLRVAADPKTRRSLEEFYEDWLRVEEIPTMNARVGLAGYDAFADGFVPSDTLDEAMAHELVALGVYHTADAPGSLDALFLSDRMVTTDGELAALYGGAPWDGEGTPPALGPERVGLLTRAGLLATGSANTRPIMKGVFIREGLLCDPLGTPPDNANAAPPELSETQTTREVVEALTEQEGTSCAACHTALINPLGYATEDFDALGRHRSTQPLFDEHGALLAEPEVDTAGVAPIGGESVRFQDAFALTDAILASGDAHRCFSREYFRYALARPEVEGADTCTIDGLGEALSAGMPLDDFLVEVAMQPQFRTLAPPAP